MEYTIKEKIQNINLFTGFRILESYPILIVIQYKVLNQLQIMETDEVLSIYSWLQINKNKNKNLYSNTLLIIS